MSIVLGNNIVELRLGNPPLFEQGAGAVEIVVGLLSHGSRLIELSLQHLDLVGPLQVRLGVGKPRLGLGQACFRRRDRRLLLGAFQNEDRFALLDGIAFLDGELGHTAALFRSDQNEIGFHVARE